LLPSFGCRFCPFQHLPPNLNSHKLDQMIGFTLVMLKIHLSTLLLACFIGATNASRGGTTVPPPTGWPDQEHAAWTLQEVTEDVSLFGLECFCILIPNPAVLDFKNV
jgi:hypothetical protein